MAVMFSSNIFIANSCYIGRNFVVQDQKVIEKKFTISLQASETGKQLLLARTNKSYAIACQ